MSGSRGAAVVEAALVLPIMMLLLAGIVDFGSAYSNYTSLRQGTRETARQAAINSAVLPTSGAWNCPITGLANVNSTATGAYGDVYDLMCYAKSRIGLSPQSNVRVSVYWDPGVVGPPSVAPYSVNSDPTSLNSVVICTQSPLTSLTGVTGQLLSGKVLTAKTEIRIEQTSTHISGASPAIANPEQETPLSSWPASCSSM